MNKSIDDKILKIASQAMVKATIPIRWAGPHDYDVKPLIRLSWKP